jgi:hypothetical protein
MRYLDQKTFAALSSEKFSNRKPYPWVDIVHPFTDQGFAELRRTLPDISQFEKMVGVKRGYGQKSHDRAILHYHPSLQLSGPWREFIAELHDDFYQSFIRRMFHLSADEKFILTLEWYYAWAGCSVSPHCDAKRKLGTQIFYFNTEEDWDLNWSGNILILDDKGRFKAHSAPGFEQLDVAASLPARDNRSLLFQRTEHSWHGVQPLGCPPGVLRKLFIITINLPTLQVWWRRVRGKDPDGYPLRGFEQQPARPAASPAA